MGSPLVPTGGLLKLSRLCRRREVAATLCALLVVSGCGGYGKLSDRGYEFAQSLYSISNREDKEGVERIEKMIAADLEEGGLTSQEGDWLNDIVADAKRGSWKSAMKNARRLMEDQVEK